LIKTHHFQCCKLLRKV